jgi:hypothetical protein
MCADASWQFSTISSCLVTIFEMLMGGGDYFELSQAVFMLNSHLA